MATNRNTKNSTYYIAISALMVALSFVLPYFMPIKIVIPGIFTATLFSHMPIIISMFISPYVAMASCAGTALAFGLMFPGDFSVAARALSHIAFILPGSLLIKRGFMCKGMWIGVLALFLTLIHALAEMLTVVGFWSIVDSSKITVKFVLLTVGVGTLIHGAIDYIASFIVYQSAVRARMLEQRFVLIDRKVSVQSTDTSMSKDKTDKGQE